MSSSERFLQGVGTCPSGVGNGLEHVKGLRQPRIAGSKSPILIDEALDSFTVSQAV